MGDRPALASLGGAHPRLPPADSEAGCDQGKDYPPMSLIKSLNSHRQAKHYRVPHQQQTIGLYLSGACP